MDEGYGAFHEVPNHEGLYFFEPRKGAPVATLQAVIDWAGSLSFEYHGASEVHEIETDLDTTVEISEESGPVYFFKKSN